MPKNEEYLGKFITVRIVKTGKHFMIGELYEGSALKNLFCIKNSYFELILQYLKYILAIVFVFIGFTISKNIF